MKKFITMAILFVVVMVACMTVVNASSSATLPDELYAIGSQYGMTVSKKTDMERYLKRHPLSDADCNKILELAQEADGIMKSYGVHDYTKLPADVKSKLKSLAVQAADIAGVTLKFEARDVKVFDSEGNEITSFSESDSTNPAGANTGANINVALVASMLAAIALAATVITKKRIAANA